METIMSRIAQIARTAGIDTDNLGDLSALDAAIMVCADRITTAERRAETALTQIRDTATEAINRIERAHEKGKLANGQLYTLHTWPADYAEAVTLIDSLSVQLETLTRIRAEAATSV